MTRAGPSESRFAWRVACGAAVLAALGFAAYHFWPPTPADVLPDRSAPDDPRLAYRGPYRNVHPDVQEVGSAVCARCHEKIANAYSHHPMGQSSFPIAESNFGNLADGGTASFDALGAHFDVRRTGNRLETTETHPGADGKPLFQLKADIAIALGSGAKGQSFLIERDGFVWQSPASWFSQKRIWDVSPGFPPSLHAGRPIQAGCLYCHTNRVVPAAGTVNRFEEPVFRGYSIGCERCHGPGAEHVRRQEAGTAPPGIDYSIVNPARLDPPLREAVCQQCHLSGETRVLRAGRSYTDFRPGLPLDSVIRVMVRDHRGDNRKAVNHVEQMAASRCFTASGGKLGCITCHDPHQKWPTDERIDRYRSACLKCHDCPTPLAARTPKGNDCVSCHMPRFTAGDIVHSASTDHRIVRRPESKSGPAAKAGNLPLVFFPSLKVDFQDRIEGRDFAVGFVDLALQGRVSRGEAVRDALPLLERSIAESPGDAAAWSAKAHALQFAGRTSEAIAAAKTVLTLRPDDEAGLAHLAALAREAKQPDLAIRCWRDAIRRNPWNAGYREELAVMLAEQDDWPAAQTAAEEAMWLDPAAYFARTVLAAALYRAGATEKAEAMFRAVEGLAPPNLADLRRWHDLRKPPIK